MLWPLIWWTSLSLSCMFSFLSTFSRASWSLISLENLLIARIFTSFSILHQTVNDLLRMTQEPFRSAWGDVILGAAWDFLDQRQSCSLCLFWCYNKITQNLFFFYYLFVFALICDWLIATRESDFIANPWHSYAFSILNFLGSPQVLLQSSIIFWLFFGHRAPRTETSAFAMHIIIAVGIIKYVHSGKEPSLLCFKKINF